jgi:hypothetical protein
LKELTVPISLNVASVVRSDVWNNCECIEKVTFTPGTGIGFDYGTAILISGPDNERLPWIISRDSFTTVIFEEGITHIGSCLLYQCKNISSVSIPSTVTSVGERAFFECTSLVDLIILGNLTDIGKKAFKDCPGYLLDRMLDTTARYESDKCIV